MTCFERTWNITENQWHTSYWHSSLETLKEQIKSFDENKNFVCKVSDKIYLSNPVTFAGNKLIWVNIECLDSFEANKFEMTEELKTFISLIVIK